MTGKKLGVVGALAGLFFGLPMARDANAAVATIENFPKTSSNSEGEWSGNQFNFFAQTFMALSGDALDLTFQLRRFSMTSDPIWFDVLIKETDRTVLGEDSLDVALSNTVFKRALRLIDYSPSFNWADITVPLNELDLLDGGLYAIVLDFGAYHNGIYDAYNIGRRDGYASGHAIVSTTADGAYPIASWDLAFRMSFSAPTIVPVPAPIWLIGVGFLSYLGIAWSRRST